MSGFVCRGCKNHFLQDRICTTCAAQKLYDATVESQGAEIERLRAANKQLVDGIDTITRRKQEEIERLRAEIERLKQEPELLRAELISLANAARKALADAYDRAREGKP